MKQVYQYYKVVHNTYIRTQQALERMQHWIVRMCVVIQLVLNS